MSYHNSLGRLTITLFGDLPQLVTKSYGNSLTLLFYLVYLFVL